MQGRPSPSQTAKQTVRQPSRQRDVAFLEDLHRRPASPCSCHARGILLRSSPVHGGPPITPARQPSGQPDSVPDVVFVEVSHRAPALPSFFHKWDTDTVPHPPITSARQLSGQLDGRADSQTACVTWCPWKTAVEQWLSGTSRSLAILRGRAGYLARFLIDLQRLRPCQLHHGEGHSKDALRTH